MSRRRVVITGMGAVTPVGNTLGETWRGILGGERPASAIRPFQADKFTTNFAYQVSRFALNDRHLPKGQEMYMNRSTRFGWNAACEALAQAGLLTEPGVPDAFIDMRRDMSLCLGVGVGAPTLGHYAEMVLGKKGDDPSSLHSCKDFPSTLTTMLAGLIGARGGNVTIHTACASSGQALGEAFDMIVTGERDVILTGGADSMINPFQVAGFCLLGAMSTRNDAPREASRPFDRGRDGFVLGEGAAMFVFEEHEHARRRGADVLGEICGYGVTETAYRITDPHPEGRGTIEAMEMALADAGIQPADVAYINAHGTSTILNDRTEALAIGKVFGKSARPVAVSSTKGHTGHLISAAGALEFAIAVLALKERTLPPSVNVTEQDALCDVRLTGAIPAPLEGDYALSNSIGFGGSNTSLIARRFP